MGKVRSIKREIERRQAKDGTITATLAQLVNSGLQTGTNPLPALHALLGQRDIPIKQSFLIGKITKGVVVEIQAYHASNKLLCEKYANKDGDGKPIILGADDKRVAEDQPGRYDIPKEKLADFNKEHQELLETEVSIAGQKIKVEELNGAKLAPAHAMNLDWLLE